MQTYVSFDWAMKRLLRDKANHAVLEGLVTSLLGRKYTIVRFLESEGNQESADDKFNRVDMLAEAENGELIIVEVQNCHELTYFHRMLYGVSKAITDYISIGSDYGQVRKVYSINIVYFELGQGKDYVYHGKTDFRGLHDPNDLLMLTKSQTRKFFGMQTDADGRVAQKEASALFPEYYVLRINDFNKVARTPIDQWMEFLKTGSISRNASAPGLAEAREKLRFDQLTEEEQQAYRHHIDALVYQKYVLDSSFEDGIAEGEHRKAEKMARELLAIGLPISQIAKISELTEDEVRKLQS